MFGSQTGTAEALAKKLAALARQNGLNPRVCELNEFGSIDWKSESRLLIVTSTWGDGDPPDNAAGFWTHLNSEAGTALSHLKYSVLALGDKNYSDFCGAGRKIDERLDRLGATRIHPRTDCDVDYENDAGKWIEAVLQALGRSGTETAVREVIKSAPISAEKQSGFSRQNPFGASLLTNRLLNQPGSSKDTRHFEILLEGSSLTYQVGDALGVVPQNSPALVQEILDALKATGDECVLNGDPMERPLREALQQHYDIRQIHGALLEAVAERTGDRTLKDLADPNNKTLLDQFLFGREVIDLLLAFPQAAFTPQEFVSLLRKLNPRLYSISSSPKAHPGEVHLTVAAVRYESHGRRREGVCSTFLADRVKTRETAVPVFVQTSHGFRLPSGNDVPIIMIGPGTGIAPFRAFLEERRAVGATGRNWLFFGDQRRDYDFLYREELEGMHEDGFLTRFDTAFSRDQAEKHYVQNRILQNAPELWSWLEAGAHVYVCGDAKRMAKDVNSALEEVIRTAGGRTAEQAGEYIQTMKADKRYQRDVY